jgi:hypothetical protein
VQLAAISLFNLFDPRNPSAIRHVPGRRKRDGVIATLAMVADIPYCESVAR